MENIRIIEMGVECTKTDTNAPRLSSLDVFLK